MPLRLIANIAQENGVITVVDGAHYGGMIVPDLDNTGIDFFGISGHKWQCGPGGTGILFARNARRISNPTPLPRFHMLRSGQLNSPVDGSRPDGFDIGATLSLYGFPESADWRALGEVCELWDLIGRDRIQNYILSLADYARAGLIRKFGEQCLMQPTKDQELKSGIIAFNPFPHKRRRDFTLSQHFQDHIFADYGYRLGMGGLGKNGLTRLPDGDAARFFDGCIPDRHAETNEPAPTDIPFRFSACIWLTRRDIDTFINVLEQAVSEMLVDIKQITV
jgi:selenocysteine lyase/cysteine desulfurase